MDYRIYGQKGNFRISLVVKFSRKAAHVFRNGFQNNQIRKQAIKSKESF